MRISAGADSRLRTMKKLICKTLFVVVAAMLSGCATSRDSQQNTQTGASITQDASPTVSGYISVGASKKF